MKEQFILGTKGGNLCVGLMDVGNVLNEHLSVFFKEKDVQDSKLRKG